MTENSDSVLSTPKQVRNHVEKFYAPLVQSSEVPGVALCTLWMRWVKFENFDLERVFSFGTLHQWCRKFLSGISYTFWPLYGRKFRFGTCNWDPTISLSGNFWSMMWGLRGLNKIFLPCSILMHCCHPPSPFSPWFLNFFLVIYVYPKNYSNSQHKVQGTSYFNPIHFNQQTWLKHLPTRALFSLSSVHPRCALASRGLIALGKSVESRTRPVSSRATLARDTHQMHSGRVCSWHNNFAKKYFYSQVDIKWDIGGKLFIKLVSWP